LIPSVELVLDRESIDSLNQASAQV
jgi:hypothetical protein